MKIRPIVEGPGEVKAVPKLLLRLRNEARVWNLGIDEPFRRPRTQLVKKDALQAAVQAVLLNTECSGALIIFDADDDCPAELGPKIETWAREAALGKPCEVVIANREYEAWFLASMEALRGKRTIKPDATSHPEPEKPRNAKGQLELRMAAGRSYVETVDQEALTATFDLESAYRRCRSFRKLVSAFGTLAAAVGAAPAEWPPAKWLD